MVTSIHVTLVSVNAELLIASIYRGREIMEELGIRKQP
jgi:hypothetical protein